MTSEEIIERLIDEKKLSVKEAMVILKDLARESVRRMFYPRVNDPYVFKEYFNNKDVWCADTVSSTTINLNNSNESK